MTAADVAAVLDVQEPGAVLGLADVFPQDEHPFPREDVGRRWLWGTGIAQAAHDAVLGRMRGRGVRLAELRVFTANGRGRRFYERLGWRPTGERSRSSFPPYPELLHYERVLS